MTIESNAPGLPETGPREVWSSRAGFILAAIGSAVGIGNIWRFPYMVGDNGGGAFLAPYLAAVLTLVLTLMIVEFEFGQATRGSVAAAFASVHARLRPFGLLLIGIEAIILSYYLVTTGWVLAFLVAFVGGISLTFDALTSTYVPVAAFVVSALTWAWIVGTGVRAGIERAAKLLMPTLVLILVGMAITALPLPGAGRGISYFLSPDLEAIRDPRVWTAAFGQSFFSLSVGTGIMLTYGSYLQRGSLTQTAAAAVASAAVIPILANAIANGASKRRNNFGSILSCPLEIEVFTAWPKSRPSGCVRSLSVGGARQELIKTRSGRAATAREATASPASPPCSRARRRKTHRRDG